MFFSQLISLAFFCYCSDVRVVEAIKYDVEIKTSTVYRSGTDANVYLTIFGSLGNTGPIKLSSTPEMLETGDVDNFQLEAKDVGKMEGLKVRHDNTGEGPGWYPSKITISIPSKIKRYVFTIERWVETDEAKAPIDKPSEVTIYDVEIKTSTVSLSGTDANVYLTIFGSLGNTGPIKLSSTPEMLETGDVDNFKFEATYVGKVEGIKVRHDNTGEGPGWYPSKITISIPSRIRRYVFTIGRWVETDEAKAPIDKPSEVFSGISYYLEVVTGSIDLSGTDAKIYLTVYGSSGNTGPLLFQTYFDTDPFETGDINYINIKSYDIGNVEGIKITHDNTGKGPGWYLSKITMTVPSKGKRYVFTPGRWVEIESAKVVLDKPSSTKDVSGASYHIKVETGKISSSGTDAKVYLLIFGSSGNIGPFQLEATAGQLETGDIDNFILDAADIGELKGIKVTHDNTGKGPGWYLSTVTITIPSQMMLYVFTPDRWVETDLAKVQIDKPIEVCPSGYSLKFYYCYKFVDEQLTGQQSAEKCSSMYSGIIASPKNQKELDYVTSLSKGKDVFIGANDLRTEGSYDWADGTKTSWTNWAPDQPSTVVGDDCVVAKVDKSWKSVQCKTTKYPAVCMTNRKRCTCKDQVKTSTDGYFANSIVPVNTESECNVKCSATTGCTHGSFFYGKCHLFFNLEPKSTNSADTCKQLCTSTSGCKTFRYTGSTCTLYKKHFNRFVADPSVSILACLDEGNLPCLE